MSPQEEKDEMRRDRLRDEQHEKCMVSDREYFIEWTVENFYLDKPMHLFDIYQKLHDHCLKYDNEVVASDILEHMKNG